MHTILFVLSLFIAILGPSPVHAFLHEASRQQLDTLDEILQRNARLALIKAKQDEKVCGQNHCNFFVAKVGELRGIPYFRDVDYPEKPRDQEGGENEGRRANTIYDFIVEAVKDPDRTGWRHVSPEEAQQLANAGWFVIGVKQGKPTVDKAGKPQRGAGHIVMVVAEDMQKSPKYTDGRRRKYRHGAGPWIRDAQHADASMRANHAGNDDVWGVKGILWVVWEYEDLHRLWVDERQGKIVIEPLPSTALPQRLRKKKSVPTFSQAELALIHSLDADARKKPPPPPPPPGSGGDSLQHPQSGLSPSTPRRDPRGGIAVDIRLTPDDFHTP